MPGSPVVQSAILQAIAGANPSLAFSKPVTPGSTLLVALAGYGYTAAAAVASAVSDSVNGGWPSPTIYNSGSLTDGASHYYSLAVFDLLNTKGGTPTIDLTATAGQSPSTLAICELATLGVDQSEGAQVTSDASGDVTCGTVSGVLAADWVLGFAGGYASSAAAVGLVSSGWTLAEASSENTTASLGLAWRDTQTSGGESPGGAVFDGFYASAAVLQAVVAFKTAVQSAANPPAIGRGPVRRLGVGPS